MDEESLANCRKQLLCAEGDVPIYQAFYLVKHRTMKRRRVRRYTRPGTTNSPVAACSAEHPDLPRRRVRRTVVSVNRGS